MLNVCTECIRLNPLDREKCNYCGGVCEKVGNERLKIFMIEFNQRKQAKEKRSSAIKEAEVKPCTTLASTTLGAWPWMQGKEDKNAGN